MTNFNNYKTGPSFSAGDIIYNDYDCGIIIKTYPWAHLYAKNYAIYWLFIYDLDIAEMVAPHQSCEHIERNFKVL